MQVNTVLCAHEGCKVLKPGIYRVVRDYAQLGSVALHQIGTISSDIVTELKPTARMPRLFDANCLEATMATGEIAVVTKSAVHAPTNRQKAALKQRAGYKKRQDILQELLSTELVDQCLFGKPWLTALEPLAKRYEVSVFAVLRLLNRYFTLQLDVSAACLDRYWTPKSTRKVSTKLGRQHKRFKAGHVPQPIGRNADESDRKCIALHYQSLPENKWSKAKLWRDYKEKFAPKTLRSASGEVQYAEESTPQPVSERQYRYALKEAIGELILQTNAAGVHATNLRHRSILGSANDGIPYPGHTYIIDSTIADCYLVCSFDRTRLIGRPVIYIVIDARSCLILGVHVALAGPNLEEAKIAMYRAVTSKTDWLRWLGVANLESNLLQGCMPTFWLADRGELYSQGSFKTQRELESNLSICAAFRAEWKAFVERTFGILNTSVIHWLPGAVQKRIQERGARDSRLDATMTMQEFTRILVRKIADINSLRDMSALLTPVMVKQGVQPCPSGVWQYGVKHQNGSAVFLPPETAREQLLPQGEARLTRRGLLFKGLRYTAEWMGNHDAIALAGFNGSRAVQLIQSPDMPTRGYCLLPDERGMREVNLKLPFAWDANNSYQELEEFVAWKQFNLEDYQDESEKIVLQTDRENSADIAAAKKLTQAAHLEAPKSKRARTNGIKATRREQIEKGAVPFFSGEPSTESTDPPIERAVCNEQALDEQASNRKYKPEITGSILREVSNW